jgi:hypothetical protein
MELHLTQLIVKMLTIGQQCSRNLLQQTYSEQNGTPAALDKVCCGEKQAHNDSCFYLAE